MATENKPNNPSAFPPSSFALEQENSSYYYEKGMTLRDYFANSAMQALITKYGKPSEYHWQNGTKDGRPELSKTSYEIADAMLKQREL